MMAVLTAENDARQPGHNDTVHKLVRDLRALYPHTKGKEEKRIERIFFFGLSLLTIVGLAMALYWGIRSVPATAFGLVPLALFSALVILSGASPMMMSFNLVGMVFLVAFTAVLALTNIFFDAGILWVTVFGYFLWVFTSLIMGVGRVKACLAQRREPSDRSLAINRVEQSDLVDASTKQRIKEILNSGNAPMLQIQVLLHKTFPAPKKNQTLRRGRSFFGPA